MARCDLLNRSHQSDPGSHCVLAYGALQYLMYRPAEVGFHPHGPSLFGGSLRIYVRESGQNIIHEGLDVRAMLASVQLGFQRRLDCSAS